MTARDDLDRLLLDMAAEGRRPVCGEYAERGASLWLSDDPADRAEAARLCLACPVLEECAAAADEADERWNVWGGRDRRRPQTRPQPKGQTR